jgi:carbamoyl-phosphate synthase large subunit
MSKYRITTPRSVLILGSGGQRIGQAGEYDDAGLAAIKALRMNGIRTILVNPNMSAVQTAEGQADATYFLPVTEEFVTRVIEKEKPDSIIVNYGGKTAFSCALALEESGTLERYGIQVLGTSLESMRLTKDRSRFIAAMRASGVPVTEAIGAASAEEAKAAAEKLGYPTLLRGDCTRGDEAPTICADARDIEAFYERAGAPKKVSVEEFLGGWKEIELEVLRDAMDNCVVACGLENVDPIGIHTGDSVVIAPCQTLSDGEARALRETAFQAVRALGVIGEANVRFAKDHDSPAFRLFEVNARVSRSTAIASRALSLPIAFASARVALGYSLSEISNPLCPESRLCVESIPNCLAVKFPRWDLDRFPGVDRHLGASMKSVGEAIAFGRTLEEALQKAVRMTMPAELGIACHGKTFKDLKEELRRPTDRWVFACYEAIAQGWTLDRVFKYARVDRWFLSSLKRIASVERELRAHQGALTRELLLRAKKAGFSDAQIADCVSLREDKVRSLRAEFAVRPVIKQIDPLSGERSSKGRAFYMTYHGVTDDAKPTGRGALVPGSGPYHIGSSLEYDWCASSAIATLRKIGTPSIVINCNPDAVTTGQDAADRVYLEEVSLERVLDVFEAERPDGVLLSYGGQATNDLAYDLARRRIPVFGTDPANVDRAEDRNKFSALLDELGIQQPDWAEVRSVEAAIDFASRAGYPVLTRPSYVDSGEAMSVAWDEASLKASLAKAAALSGRTLAVSSDRPVIVSRYVENSKEIEIDAVAKDGEILVYAISEHIENAGVHSGDATVVLPAQRIYLSTAQQVKKAARKIAKALSPSPGRSISSFSRRARRSRRSPATCARHARSPSPRRFFAPTWWTSRYARSSGRGSKGRRLKARPRLRGRARGAVQLLAPQGRRSRGGRRDVQHGRGSLPRARRPGRVHEGAHLGWLPRAGEEDTSFHRPIEDKVDFIDSAKKLKAMGYELVASGGTARFLNNNGVDAIPLAWPLEDKRPNIADALRSGEVDLIINIPKNNRETELKNDFIIRRMAIDLDIPLITNIKIAKQFTDALEWYKTRGLETKSREDYGLQG